MSGSCGVRFMDVLWTEMVRWVNLPWTILLALLVVYWLVVMIGLLDIDLLEFDGEAGFLEALNPGQVPLTVWLSIFGLLVWVGSVTGNLIVTLAFQDPAAVANGIRFLGQLVLILPLSIWITTKLSKSMRPLFSGSDGLTRDDLIGKTAIVTSGEATDTFGTAEIRGHGSPILIHVTMDSGDVAHKGDRVMVVSYDEENRTYHVTHDV